MLTSRKIPAFSKKVADLPDTPSSTITAEELKAQFDSSPEELRIALNGTIDDVVTDYATKSELNGIALGQVPNGSITEPKLETSLAQKVNGGLNDFLSRQAVINGNFDVWQRGANFSAIGYGPDRWFLIVASGSAITLSRQPFAVGQTEVPNNPDFFTQLTISSAVANSFFIQKIENVKQFAGQKVTLSFWARCTAGTYQLSEYLYQNFGSGGSTAVSSATFSQTITTNWQRFSVTFDVPSISGKTITANNTLELTFALLAGSGTSTIQISQVQLNAGAAALPFQPKSVANEISDSLRYSWIPQGSSVFVRASQVSINVMVFHVPLPVMLRTTPSIRGGVNTDMVVCSISGGAQTGFAAAVALTGSGVTLTMTKTSHGLSDAYLEIKPTSGFDAEL